MKNGKIIAGAALAILALIMLGGIIFAGAKHHFFTFLTIGGLAYAILTEGIAESKEGKR